VVGMRWNQPWNFSRLLKHLTEHRMGRSPSVIVFSQSEAEIRSRTWQKWTFFERAAGEAKLLNNYIHERCDGNL
jgi:hypothetical protein